MNRHKQTDENETSTLAEDARALMAATADVAGEQVAEARRRLTAGLASGKQLIARARDKTLDGAKATDQLVRENPYQTIGIAFGVGALIGFLLARRRGRNDD